MVTTGKPIKYSRQLCKILPLLFQISLCSVPSYNLLHVKIVHPCNIRFKAQPTAYEVLRKKLPVNSHATGCRVDSQLDNISLIQNSKNRSSYYNEI
jgi:hypothetical protein